MFGLAAFVAFLVGFLVSKAYEHPDASIFWLFIGLMLLALHETFGGIVAQRRNAKW